MASIASTPTPTPRTPTRFTAYGGGTDYIYVNNGDTLDIAGGGTGYDWCYVDARVEAYNTCNRVVVC